MPRGASKVFTFVNSLFALAANPAALIDCTSINRNAKIANTKIKIKTMVRIRDLVKAALGGSA